MSYSRRDAPTTRGHRHAGRDRGPLPTTQAEYIAGRLLEAERLLPNAAHGRGVDALEILIKTRSRISLRWFTFEPAGAHRYHHADRLL